MSDLSLTVIVPASSIIVSESDKEKDGMDPFNHPRQRRALILQALGHSTVTADAAHDLSIYSKVSSPELLDFLLSAWDQWQALGEAGQDPTAGEPGGPFTPINMPLPRTFHQPSQPSQHVLGKVGYYCTDTCTPIFEDLSLELLEDAGCLQAALESSKDSAVTYLLQTHPGHHAALDSFGGYCYVNHVAALAAANHGVTAVLDVDYHCGNGTASIFYENPHVFVASIHCDPNFDYPFHSGFAHETGEGDGQGTTLHVPLPPGTTWKEYRVALEDTLQRIALFQPTAVIVSLGLDTYHQDPCAIRRAGFALRGDDYKEMGRAIGEGIPGGIPIIFVQEGGYRMDAVGDAAANVVVSCSQVRSK